MLDDYLIAERLPGRTTLDTVALHIDRYDNLIEKFTSTDTEEMIEGGGIGAMGHVGAHLILPTKRTTRNDVQGNMSSCDTVLGRQVLAGGIDYGLITEWLNLCTSTHVKCGESQLGLGLESIPGFRLIDCFTNTIVPASQATEREYVTLSYVWGPNPAPVSLDIVPGGNGSSTDTTEANNEYALPEVEDLPNVIRDSLIIVRNLGYRYFWADRYCIPQDDARAKHIQIQNMGKIYSASIFTIIAAPGTEMDLGSGIPGVSSRPRIPQVSTTVCNGQLPLTLYRCPIWDIDCSPWNRRGWTLQEGLLARRRLVFTSRYLYFQCCVMDKSEQLSQPPRLLRNNPPPPTLETTSWETESSEPEPQWHLVPANVCGVFPYSDEWHDESNIWSTISEFNERTLSFDSDALNAMRGIVQLYRITDDDRPVKFLCGLPTINPILSDEIESDIEFTDEGSVTDSEEDLPRSPRTKVREEKEKTEDAERFERMKFVVEQDPNMDLATARLVPGLLWKDKWAQATIDWSQPINPKPLSQADTNRSPRRSMFPTWTWAGWKKTEKYSFWCECLGYKLSPLYYRKRDCLIQPPIKVSFDGVEDDLNWTTDHLHIMELSDSGKNPTHLVLTGKIINVELRCEENNSRRNSLGEKTTRLPFIWRYTSPSQLRDESVDLPPDHVDGEGQGNTLADLLLLLVHRTFKRTWRKKSPSEMSSYHFLLLRPVQDEAHGLVYERLTSTSIPETSFHSDFGNMLYNLETREIRIR